MPTFVVRKSDDVPQASKATKAVRDKQQQYEDFIREIGSDVGELELASGEAVRSVKVRLRRASTRIGKTIEIWDVDGRVYFSAQDVKRRGRPRKQS